MSPHLRDAALRGALPVIIVAALLVTASVAVMSTTPIVDLQVALFFVALITVGEVVRITLPGDRESAPLAAAGALAYALLPAFNGSLQLPYGVPQVVVVATAGSLLGTLPHMLTGRSVRVEDLARRIVVVSVVAAVFRPLLPDLVINPSSPLDFAPSPKLAFVMMVVAVLGGVVDNTLAAVARSARDHAPFVRSFIDEGRAIVGIGSAITATGVLIALAAGTMGAIALVVFSVPLLLTQFSFRRYAAIRATYLQTIRSLSRVTDVGGYTEAGHAQRVARLARAVGRELGLSEADLLDLDYAALMHDIGQLSLQDPIPGGATSLAPQETQRRIAELGAAVIREASVMGDVATIVERQADPFRPVRGESDATLPIESRIIRVCNAYDDVVGSSPSADKRHRAVEALRVGCSHEYDPRVVDTLNRVVGHHLAYAY